MGAGSGQNNTDRVVSTFGKLTEHFTTAAEAVAERISIGLHMHQNAQDKGKSEEAAAIRAQMFHDDSRLRWLGDFVSGSRTLADEILPSDTFSPIGHPSSARIENFLSAVGRYTNSFSGRIPEINPKTTRDPSSDLARDFGAATVKAIGALEAAQAEFGPLADLLQTCQDTGWLDRVASEPIYPETAESLNDCVQSWPKGVKEMIGDLRAPAAASA